MLINKLPFLFAIATLVLIAASFILQTPAEGLNNDLLMIAFYFAIAYWLLTVIMVASSHKLKPAQKKFWLIVLISLPFIGGLLYQLLQLYIKKLSHQPKQVMAESNLYLREQSL